MASAPSLALAGSDSRLLHAIQRHLSSAVELRPPGYSFDAVRSLLAPPTEGSLVLLAARPNDADTIFALVQEICLRRLPMRVLVLETEDAAGGRNLAELDAHVDARLAWPDHGRGLTSWVRRQTPVPGWPGSEPASLTDAIARRLLPYTPTLASLIESLALAAAHNVTVLIDGETGTGKTHLARLIHDCSPRQPHRFVVVPCGALSANLVESEFFGHTKGAFTGADSPKVGKFAAAGQGTILLDEIDALGLEHQANLLRVIETGEFEPVGSNETQMCEARIIVATNWNLEEAVERGQFRRDLYYRLNVMPFYLPPLRERAEDIGPLVRGMAARFAAKFCKDLFAVNAEVIRVLETFPWPGNIRQLENVVQQAVLLSSGPELLAKHLPPLVQNQVLRLPERHSTAQSLAQRREVSEREAIQRALEECGYSRTRAAQALGVSRVTLYKKMKKYGLSPRTAAGWGPDEADEGARAAIA